MGATRLMLNTMLQIPKPGDKQGQQTEMSGTHNTDRLPGLLRMETNNNKKRL